MRGTRLASSLEPTEVLTFFALFKSAEPTFTPAPERALPLCFPIVLFGCTAEAVPSSALEQALAVAVVGVYKLVGRRQLDPQPCLLELQEHEFPAAKAHCAGRYLTDDRRAASGSGQAGVARSMTRRWQRAACVIFLLLLAEDVELSKAM